MDADGRLRHAAAADAVRVRCGVRRVVHTFDHVLREVVTDAVDAGDFVRPSG